MLFVSFIQWWYGDGWRQRARKLKTNLDGTMDFFSISLLLKTLFQPFRQISAGSVDGAIDTKLRAWFDRLVSRLIGAAVRLVIMLAGIVAITMQVVFGVILMIFWAIVPALPIVGIILAITGVSL